VMAVWEFLQSKAFFNNQNKAGNECWQGFWAGGQKEISSA